MIKKSIRMRVGLGVAVFAVAAISALALWKVTNRPKPLVVSRTPTKFEEGKTHLEVEFPIHSKVEAGQPRTRTFYIPNEYLDRSGVISWPSGRYSVPIIYELPSRKAVQIGVPRKVVEVEGVGQSAAIPRLGTFRLMLSFGVEGAAEFLNYQVNGKATHRAVQISPIAGLQRYAQLDCLPEFPPSENELYIQARIKGVAAKRAQGEPDDPVVPTNCAIDRNRVTLFTPIGEPEASQLYIVGCDRHSCDSTFRVAGVPARLHIPKSLLPRWREVVEPSRALAESFLANPQSKNSVATPRN